MITKNTIQYLTINYSDISVLNFCNNCDNLLEDREIRYKTINNITKETKIYCCQSCLKEDLLKHT